ncbi:MAG: hypothetical protein Q7U77_02915, partial [Sediminibacterium sp.]|uniref:hypothetical protein n=1 Tax=Sediminibacterium sp. TaxID=1917865 RepID=UPI00271B2F4E
FDQIINQNNINSAANSGKDIFDYLGLSDTLSEETKNKISKAILEATTNVQIEAKKKLDLSSSSGLGSSLLVQLFGATNEQADLAIGTFNRIFNAYQQMIDMQITAKDRQLGILRDQINEVENELNRELDAQKNGYASNVAAKQLELDQLKAQRDKELADQKELIKQKAQLAAASAATESIVQAAQLGSAAAIAFKKGQESSFNPILGVILALAAIATMVTGFITIKAQMKAAAAPQFDEGGGLVLEGPDHSQGGLDVVEKRTGKTKANVRGGEYMYVFKHTKAKEFEDVFNLINDNQGASLSDVLREIGGIHIIEDAPKIIMPILQKRNEEENDYRNAMITMAYNSDELISIKKELKEFKEAWQTEPRVVDYGDFVEITMGNIRKKVKKSKS